MAKGGDGKISNGLVAASCAAILAVYTAGYSRTRDAADKFDAQAHERRPAVRSEQTTAVVQGAPAAGEASSDPTADPTLRHRESIEPTAAGTAPAIVAVDRVPLQSETPTTTPAPVVVPAPSEVAATTAPANVAPTPAPAPAQAAPPVAEPAPTPKAPKWIDGTYTGWGTSRHGDIQARVVIKDNKIVDSGIAQCLTRYSCDVIDQLILQPVKRQSPDVDYVSRATESSDAYYYALVEALSKANPEYLPSATSAQ
jgi:uncharacterized protein with FMN-binding domain